MYSFRRAIFCHTVHSSGEGVSFRNRSNIYKRGQRKRKKKIEEKKKKKSREREELKSILYFLFSSVALAT